MEAPGVGVGMTKVAEVGPAAEEPEVTIGKQ